MKRLFVSLLPVLLVVAIGALAFTGTGCANIIPPAGGPVDSLPPVLLDATPDDSTTNFRGNRIVLTFDEFVDLQEVQQNLLFTPTFERNPEIMARLRTLTIRMRDSLEANTTYTFDFGNAIKDINEGNILRNFSYTFSTGPRLDSLQIRGRVLLAETGTVDSTLMVVLHNQLDDSAVRKQRPRYVTRLDGNGNFTFRNLPADTFAIYALGDAGGSRRYMSNSQLFAFSNDSLVLPRTGEVTLYAYRETEPTPPGAPGAGTRPSAADRRLVLNTNLAANQQDLLNNLVLTFERPLRTFDSTRIALSTDSVFTPVTAYTARLDTTEKILTLQTAWRPDTRYNLVLDRDFAEDTLGRKLLKTDTLVFNTRAEADYGRISIRVRNVNTVQNPVLQFIQNGKVVFGAPIANGTFSQRLFLPGEYELRVLSDTNRNGVWDPGQFFGVRKQPETVRPIERRISVKAALDNEFEVTL